MNINLSGASSSSTAESGGYSWKSKKIALKSCHGKWFSAQSNGKVEVRTSYTTSDLRFHPMQTSVLTIFTRPTKYEADNE